MNENILIKDLSVADLKASLDFIHEDLKGLEFSARKKGVEPSVLPAWLEAKNIEFNVHAELINRTRALK